MKKLSIIFAVIFTFIYVFSMNGQQSWIDVNFTRDKANFPDTLSSGAYTNETYGLNTFVNNFGRMIKKFDVNNPEYEFSYSFRVSRNVSNFFTFPVYDNIGTIKINTFNTNTTIDSYIPVLYNSGTAEAPVWSNFDPVVQILVKKNDDASTYTRYSEVALNLNTPTQLRFGSLVPSNNAPNVLIYAIEITKISSTTSIDKTLYPFDLVQSGRTISVETDSNSMSATVYNHTGVEIGKFNKNEKFNFKTSGTFILKVETDEKSISQKIIVL